MAIFDGANDLNTNCKNSIKAATEISSGIKNLNNQMQSDFSEELRFGIGIHVGNTIVGMMGYGETVSETAVGDNVNIASRLEELNKKFGRIDLIFFFIFIFLESSNFEIPGIFKFSDS